MPKKILIVDDDPDLVEAVTLILKSKKYNVVAAYGGIEGLEKAKTEKPDLIVLDVMMPDKDGYTVCKELKADPESSSIPVLLLTAVVSWIPTTRYTQQLGRETKPDDYMDTPVEPVALVKRIERGTAYHLEGDGELAAALRQAAGLAGELGLAADEVAALAVRMKEEGYPPGQHSAAYRLHYRPAYRVVAARFLPTVPTEGLGPASGGKAFL